MTVVRGDGELGDTTEEVGEEEDESNSDLGLLGLLRLGGSWGTSGIELLFFSQLVLILLNTKL
jgi:hypothetical protein